MKLSNQFRRCLLIAAYNHMLETREWLLDAMTVVSSYAHTLVYKGVVTVGGNFAIETIHLPKSKFGTIVCINDKFLGMITEYDSNDRYIVEVLQEKGKPIYDRLDVFDLGPNDTTIFGKVKFVTSIAGLTSVGRLLENCCVFGYPFQWEHPYLNEEWKDKKILKMIADLAVQKKITVDQLEASINNFFFLNHMTEICCPTLTEKSLGTHPDVPKVKADFIKEHKDDITNPLVAAELEAKLEKLDAEYMGDDPSVRFFDGLGSNAWKLHRKKMFLTVGCIDSFEENEGNYDFIPNSLAEGWTKEAIPTIANEIRKGSYNRGAETAKGGAETKLVMRVFQDLTIDEEDCGTKRTIEADFSYLNPNDFIGRNIQTSTGDVTLTLDNIKQYAGQKVRLYSPLTCETTKGFCYKCCGIRTKELDARFIGIQTVKITSRFMYLAMKNMHGTVLKVRDVDYRQAFL